MHSRCKLFSIPVRILIGLWAGIVFFGGYAARAQRSIDTVHLFTPHADTVWLGLDDILPLSATDTTFHYLYRWFYKGENVGKESVLNYSFTGERKAKVIGQRFSTPFPWPGEEYLDMEFFKDTPSITYDWIDTLYLKAFSEYESDSTAKWIWAIKVDDIGNESQREYTLMGPRVKFICDKETLWWNDVYTITCTLLTETEEKHSPEGHISLWPVYWAGKMCLTDSGRRGIYYLNALDVLYTRVYAHKEDTLYFDGRSSKNPSYSGWSNASISWKYHGKSYYNIQYFPISFDGTRYKDVLEYTGRYGDDAVDRHPMYVYFGIKPDAEIESESVWVFFPQYPYSNLGGRMDICWPPDAPLPADSDTVYTFNLGPWNRELEYVEYAWLDGTKDAAGRDSIVGRDSVFYYTFGKMDSVAPDLYTGTLVTRVANDSLWQDSCSCYIPCTDDACHRYDTVRIYLHLLPEHNSFFPRDNVLCAHLDLELDLSDTAADYRCFWLDRDSVALPYGYDTALYTVPGMRGLDGYGAGTDTREPRFFQLKLDHKLCGISFFDTLLVYDQVKPVFELLCHDTLICLDEPVEIDTLSPHVYRPFYVFEWNDGTKGSGYTFTDSGVYVLQFFVGKDFAVCGYDTISDTIRVRWSDPAQTLITLSDTSFCEKLSVTLDASVPFPTTLYSWREGPLPDPEDIFEDEEDTIIFTSPIKVIKEEGTYNISLFDTMGCVNRKEINITIDDCSPKLDIPNVFTPNGDGVNDIWKFKQLEWCVDVKVEVVDRWGQPVLKTKVAAAEDFGWNGTVNNKGRRLPDGPYFYMVTYKDVYGKSKVQSGSITILGTAE